MEVNWSYQSIATHVWQALKMIFDIESALWYSQLIDLVRKMEIPLKPRFISIILALLQMQFIFVFLIRSSRLMSGNVFKSQSKLNAPCQRKRWRSYLCKAGVLLCNFGSRKVNNGIMWCQSQRDLSSHRKSMSARLEIPIRKHRSESANIHEVYTLCYFWCTQMAPRSWRGICCHQEDWRSFFFFVHFIFLLYGWRIQDL